MNRNSVVALVPLPVLLFILLAGPTAFADDDPVFTELLTCQVEYWSVGHLGERDDWGWLLSWKAERAGFTLASGCSCTHAPAALRESNRVRKPIPSPKNERPRKGAFLFLAERVGFEPTVRVNRTPDFESGPFDHSGTSPVGR